MEINDLIKETSEKSNRLTLFDSKNPSTTKLVMEMLETEKFLTFLDKIMLKYACLPFKPVIIAKVKKDGKFLLDVIPASSVSEPHQSMIQQLLE
jgi:hypothetical protein